MQARRHGAICDVNHREQAELAQQHAALEAILDSAAAATDEARTGLAQARVKRTEEEEYEVRYYVAAEFHNCPITFQLDDLLRVNRGGM